MNSKKEKMVSIILPVFNGAEYVGKSIESVINQTYQNWELIIVDDCSTDDTFQVVSEYQKQDSRIKVIRNKKNMKLPFTLNIGFSQARGAYFTWTSDDNMYKPEAFSRLVEELEKNPGLSMVYSDYTKIDRDDNILEEVSLSAPEMLVAGNVCGASFMYTAQIAHQVGIYDLNLFLAEDYDYWIRIYQNGKMKHISENLYFYRCHSGALTETKSIFIKEQTYKVIEKNFSFLYIVAKENEKQYLLFDYILRTVALEKYDTTKKMLIDMEKGYKKHMVKQKIISSLRNSFIWKQLRKVIR